MMKKLCLLPLLALLLLCLCASALADGFASQQSIYAITDANGTVDSLTDDDTTTAWIKSGAQDVDLTLTLYSASVGEIWIRSGYAYTQNWYNHYDRPDQVKVTVYYRVNQYTESYDTFRYRLEDVYQPNTRTENWRSGYQRLLLPQKYTGVTKIELTVESSIRGFGNAGVAISDIAVTGGSHATATPKAYATATPKPYIVYVTPTPGPAVNPDDLVEYITPIPDDPDDDATPTPYIEWITATPKPTSAPTPTQAPVEYPSDSGVVATLSQRIATRSGPGNRFDEPGSFFSAGHEVKVITKGWDAENRLWWFQVEFEYDNAWYRAYTPETRVDVDPDVVPTESDVPIDSVTCIKKCQARFGPGEEYKLYHITVIHEGIPCDVYAIENGWVQIEYVDYGLVEPKPRRGWVPLDCMYEED